MFHRVCVCVCVGGLSQSHSVPPRAALGPPPHGPRGHFKHHSPHSSPFAIVSRSQPIVVSPSPSRRRRSRDPPDSRASATLRSVSPRWSWPKREQPAASQ
uniref:Putative secreted protein n=1 Tax=Anopheles triannulatus TaxID=58253 RepID=A0A2M4B336_9DIPT